MIINEYGSCDRPTVALTQYWDDEQERMVCGVLILHYYHFLDVHAAEELADRIEQLVAQGEQMNLHGVPSTMKNDDPYVLAQGGFTRKRSYGMGIRLCRPDMQLPLHEALQLAIDIRQCVTISLATIKGVARQKNLHINGKFIEHVIDTEDKKVLKEQRSKTIRDSHRQTRLASMGR